MEVDEKYIEDSGDLILQIIMPMNNAMFEKIAVDFKWVCESKAENINVMQPWKDHDMS